MKTVELERRLFHISFGTLLALLLHFNLINKPHLTIILVISLVTFLIYRRWKIPLLHQAMLVLERKENLKTFPGIGAFFYLLGCTIAAWIYPTEIAVASILILAWGDGTSALIGTHGKIPYLNPKKMWEGILFGIIAGTIAAQFFVPFLHALAAAVVCMLIEGLDLRKYRLDDNLLMPILAGIVMTML